MIRGTIIQVSPASLLPKPFPSVVIRTATLCLIWSLFGLLGYARHFLADAHPTSLLDFWTGLPGWLLCYLSWVPLTPLIFRLERRFPLEPPFHLSKLAALSAATLLFSYSAYALTIVLAITFKLRAPSPSSWALPWQEGCIEATMFCATAAVASAIRRFRELEARRSEAAQFAAERSAFEAELRKAELETLRMRLNPHFLFNALQSISVLAQQDAPTAARMLTKLGGVLRTAIRPDFQEQVSLRREIELTCDYLELEKMRFASRLTYRISLEPGTESILVPSLLLQPLVENAVIHGLAASTHGGEIQIQSRRAEGYLLITVTDSGKGFPGAVRHPNSGIGLTSTRERLERLYPGHSQHLNILHRPEGGTEVQLRLPEASPYTPPSHASHSSLARR